MNHLFHNAPATIIELRKPLTLTGANRYESARRKWASKLVLIYSKEHHAFWRANAQGYTSYVSAAGYYSFEDAFRLTKHCDRSKGIVFYPAPLPEAGR